MTALGEKYRKMSDEDDRQRREQLRLQKIEEEKRKQETLLAAPQRAQEVIDRIPQIIEEAIKKGKRVAEIPFAGGVSNFESHGFWTPYWLPKRDTIARLVFDYCVKQGLRPKVRDVGGWSKDGGNSPSLIEIQW